MLKILLVEDDIQLGYIIKNELEILGDYQVTHVLNGEEGLNEYHKLSPDIIIADLEMPIMDGLTMLRQIRKKDLQTPFIIETAKILPKEVALGYNSGADNYIKKPFLPEELYAVINAIMRRNQDMPIATTHLISIGNNSLNTRELTLTINSNIRKLTVREAQILELLCSNRNEVVLKEDIINKFWGEYDIFKARSLDVFINRLRNYLSIDSSIELITIRGKGFKLIY